MAAESDFKRVWFITGASRGIGLEIAKATLDAGDAVAATARRASAVTDRLGDRRGLLALDLDVTDEATVGPAVASAVEQFGRIDVLVNNAGFGLIGAVEEATAEEVRRIYDTNVFGLLNVTRAVLPHMRRRHSGHVLNLSSIGGFRSAAGFGVYCSTKFAVEGLSEALADELTPLGIRVTVIEPGYFRTEFLDATSVAESPHRIDDYAETAGRVRRHAVEINKQQPGDPAKLASGLLELVASEQPPVRLAFGSDAVAGVGAKARSVLEDLEAWRALSTSTDF